jgi:hypothetical protein
MRYLFLILFFLPFITKGQIYHTDGSGGLTYTIDSFTTSGTWNKPAGVDYVYFYIIGGGPGGGGGRRGLASSIRSGGAAFSAVPQLVCYRATDLNTTESITIGTGGSGGVGATVNSTSGGAGGAGGDSYVRSTSFARSPGRLSVAGATTILTVGNNNSQPEINRSTAEVISATSGSSYNGTTSVANDAYRPNSANNLYSWRGSSSAGGSITSTNTLNNSGGIAGFYNEVGTLTGQVATGKGQGLNGDAIADGYSIGNYIAQFLYWFDPADITSEMPRGGMGGGPGDTAGTIAGGNGEVGRGYGASGGGGGGATNGANGGNGAAGNPGIIIAINVFE